jgi:hypothetical protein
MMPFSLFQFRVLENGFPASKILQIFSRQAVQGPI